MSYKYMICIDTTESEMQQLDHTMVCYESNPERIRRRVNELSMRWPNNTICVYSLQEIQKVKTPAEYARYAVNDIGEVTPL